MSAVTNPKAPLVELRNIHKAFGGVQAVQDVSLAVYPGEVVALLGHNGAGKSTLMKMLAAAYPIDRGELRVAGQVVKIDNPADSQNLGIETLYQTLALADKLDSVANLFLGRELTVGTYRTAQVTEDEVLGMIIAGKKVSRVAEQFGPIGPIGQIGSAA